ncbi:MAG: hypothetical protein LBH84_03240, partial [Prevotellaceae bacterium]|nr:hypothetical protein [Prevotellaceae bacterium]
MKKICFVLASLIALQAMAQGSILTKTYYLNEFNGTSVDDGNGAWSTNNTMPGSISQADGSL